MFWVYYNLECVLYYLQLLYANYSYCRLTVIINQVRSLYMSLVILSTNGFYLVCMSLLCKIKLRDNEDKRSPKPS